MSEMSFEPGRNCWRVAHADRAAVIVDACDYYRIIRQAMIEARHRIMIIGWDFDPRIKLDRTGPDSEDETLGSFLLDHARRKPHVAIKILKWDVGALKMLFRGSAMLWLARWMGTRAIRLALDHAHPTGCSHHQKIVVIDDSFAVCGGIDMTGDRWDRSEHADDDPDRVRPNGKPYGPWHDATMAVEGELAAILGELGRARWKCATGEDLPPIESPSSLWPEELEPHFTNVDLAVARTRAAWEDYPEVRESEALFLDMIASAKRFIYVENQYFASPRIAAAIARRMSEADPPEIVIVSPLRSDGWLEQKAMDATRVRLCQFVGRPDTRNRFRIYNPVTEAGQPIYVHAKVMIVDDRLLRVGSSNMNNRSLGLDSECDLAIEANNERQSATIAGVRTRLMAEHLGTSEEVVAATFAKERSLIGTIQALQRGGRTLELLEFEEPGEVEKFVAETELLDPKSPDMMFENMTKRTLFSGLRRRVARP